MKKIVVKKGYTLEVESWENDGDNYKTNFKTVDTLKEAIIIDKIGKELFCSCNNGEGGIGNSMDDSANQTILDYVENNAYIFPDLIMKGNSEILDYFRSLAYEVMGNSEWYDFRIVEKCIITYSPENIEVEVIAI